MLRSYFGAQSHFYLMPLVLNEINTSAGCFRVKPVNLAVRENGGGVKKPSVKKRNQ